MRVKRWLELAVSEEEYEYSEVFEGDGYVFSTDGIRMHIVKLDRWPTEDEKAGVIGESMIKLSEQAQRQASLFINPILLLEALQGFISEHNSINGIKLEVYTVDDMSFIVLESLEGRMAYVMGKYEGLGWKERGDLPLAERMPSKKGNASASSDTNPEAPR